MDGWMDGWMDGVDYLQVAVIMAQSMQEFPDFVNPWRVAG